VPRARFIGIPSHPASGGPSPTRRRCRGVPTRNRRRPRSLPGSGPSPHESRRDRLHARPERSRPPASRGGGRSRRAASWCRWGAPPVVSLTTLCRRSSRPRSRAPSPTGVVASSTPAGAPGSSARASRPRPSAPGSRTSPAAPGIPGVITMPPPTRTSPRGPRTRDRSRRRSRCRSRSCEQTHRSSSAARTSTSRSPRYAARLSARSSGNQRTSSISSSRSSMSPPVWRIRKKCTVLRMRTFSQT